MKVKINKHIVMSVYSDYYEVTVSPKGYKLVKDFCIKSSKKSCKVMWLPFMPWDVKVPECKIDDRLADDECIIEKVS